MLGYQLGISKDLGKLLWDDTHTEGKALWKLQNV